MSSHQGAHSQGRSFFLFLFFILFNACILSSVYAGFDIIILYKSLTNMFLFTWITINIVIFLQINKLKNPLSVFDTRINIFVVVFFALTKFVNPVRMDLQIICMFWMILKETIVNLKKILPKHQSLKVCIH